MKKVLIFGATGMLGSMVRRYLSEQGYELTCPTRQEVDCATVKTDELRRLLSKYDYVVNCAGIIKPRMEKMSVYEILDAYCLNSMLPEKLEQAARFNGSRVIQIATDCVFSGKKGKYVETNSPDYDDAYGKSKHLGEVKSPFIKHLRCSIVGPELESHMSLRDWFVGHPQGAKVKGYINHRWNGITTLAFAKICHGIMRTKLFHDLQPVSHVVPNGSVTKAELLGMFKSSYRPDIEIEPVEAEQAIDRTLATLYPIQNRALWKSAGYELIPTIGQLIEEMAAYQ